MKIFIKNLQQQQFPYEVNPSDSVLDLKKRIQEDQKHDISWQKLIFSGKILSDETTLESNSVQEGNFLVLMVRKPKETPKTQTVSTPPVVSQQPTPAAEKLVSPASPTPVPESPVRSPAVDPLKESESNILRIMELGFDREKVIRALRASFNNPDRAVEFLMSDNIPEDLSAPQPQIRIPQATQGQAGSGQTAAARSTEGGAGGAGGSGLLEAFRQMPQSNQIRQMIQQNPHLLEPFLQQIGAANPQLLEYISQHPEELMQIINEAEEEGNASGDESQTQYLQVTEDERDAIERLTALGFDKSTVIEAYFICDKDENLTANYLLEHGGE